MKLEEILRVTPQQSEIAAARARVRALARFRESPGRKVRLWTPALALAALCLMAVALLRSGGSVDTLPPDQVLRVKMTLSDGTRVEWTFHEGFRL